MVGLTFTAPPVSRYRWTPGRDTKSIYASIDMLGSCRNELFRGLKTRSAQKVLRNPNLLKLLSKAFLPLTENEYFLLANSSLLLTILKLNSDGVIFTSLTSVV